MGDYALYGISNIQQGISNIEGGMDHASIPGHSREGGNLIVAIASEI